MKRKLEPEVMDDQEQSEAYAAADFAQVNEAFVRRFRDTFPTWEQGYCVDLGCGPADIPLRMCQHFPNVHVLGVDASKPMLALGLREIQALGLGDRVELLCAMLPLDNTRAQSMDAVISNSLLHHLPVASVLWDAVKALGKPGAPVLVVDLRRPVSEDEALSLMNQYAEGEPDILRHDFYHSLLAAFTPEEVEAQLEEAGLAQALRVEVISDRHLAVSGHLP